MSQNFDVRHFAHLARLAVDEKDIPAFQAQMGSILDLFNQLGELDLKDVPPTYAAVQLVNVIRPDVSAPSLPRDEILARFPRHEEGQLRVPQMIGGDE
jgi:aspartyl-tRNA(Asn)/glutamyl-tRNA(Gln) amidotransferase subunit C